jgi:hypothetical protein
MHDPKQYGKQNWQTKQKEETQETRNRPRPKPEVNTQQTHEKKTETRTPHLDRALLHPLLVESF